MNKEIVTVTFADGAIHIYNVYRNGAKVGAKAFVECFKEAQDKWHREEDPEPILDYIDEYLESCGFEFSNVRPNVQLELSEDFAVSEIYIEDMQI